MRFQRVILHFHPTVGGGTITEPLLLADYLKQIMLGPNAPSLPQDLQRSKPAAVASSASTAAAARAGCVAPTRSAAPTSRSPSSKAEASGQWSVVSGQ